MLAPDEGAAAVRLARSALEATFHPRPGAESAAEVEGTRLPHVFDEPRGAFVTLNRYPGGALRGCIGYPLPVLPLRSAVVRAAVSAALEDYRFRPLSGPELARVTVEVSVLTPPVPLRFSTPQEAIRQVKVGRDGLIVDGFGSSGLLLPQVAPEEGWSAEELLDGTCEKAGLPPKAWHDPRVQVRRFEAEVFHELAPGGDIARVDPAKATSGGPSARKK